MDKSEDAEVSSAGVRPRHVLLSGGPDERRPHGCFSTPGPLQDISAVVDGLEGMKLSQALVLSLPDFELIRVIGRGSYAKVLLVRLKKNEQVYAMKVVKKELVHDDEVRTRGGGGSVMNLLVWWFSGVRSSTSVCSSAPNQDFEPLNN